MIAPPGDDDFVVALEGADFIHFYTLGTIALSGDSAALYDETAQNVLQSELLPASSDNVFIPVYPPQTAVLFALFALWPFRVAALLWALTTVVAYAWAVRAAWRRSREAFPDVVFVVAAAAAFPPFWSLVVYGQTTVIPLVGFTLGWLALERRQPFLAGLALGLLAVKPQFGLVLALVVLSCREWRMLAGAVTSAFLQAVAVVLVFGPAALAAYVGVVLRLPELQARLEPKPLDMHSIATLTGLLPGWWAPAAWVVGSIAVTAVTVRVWRTRTPVAVRMGVLVMGSLLVNPHVTFYEVTVLALPILWFGGWLRSDPDRAVVPAFWTIVCLLFVTLLLPTARFVWVQASVLLVGWLFVAVSRVVVRAAVPARR